MSGFHTGAQVEWAWGDGTGRGKIKKRFTDDVTRKIKGSEVKRKASKSEPAFLIGQDDGSEVLKGHSEVRKVS